MPTLRSSGRATLAFVVLTIALGWLRAVPAALEEWTDVDPGLLLQTVVLLLGSFAPLWAALIVTSRRFGGPGVGAVLRQGLRWRVGAAAYVIAVAAIVLLAFVALGVALLLGATAPTFGVVALVDAVTIFVLALVLAAGEEFRLARLPAAGASTALGCSGGRAAGRGGGRRAPSPLPPA